MNKQEDWTRVVLYGTYDGFVRSTVDQLQIAVRLDGGERVEIPSECVMSADQIVKKDEIKLKDVIKRIKDFDLVTQGVWINGILNELGSDYGTLKYKAGYEQGKLEGSLIPYDEPQKVVVSEEEAKFLETFDFNCESDVTTALYHVSRAGWGYYLRDNNGIDLKDLSEGFRELENRKRLIKAILDGYEVEKEKRYRVKAKGVYHHSSVLKLDSITGRWFFGSEKYMCGSLGKHTRKELEDAGFGEVFNSPLFEVEEVEG